MRYLPSVENILIDVFLALSDKIEKCVILVFLLIKVCVHIHKYPYNASKLTYAIQCFLLNTDYRVLMFHLQKKRK